MRALLHDDLVKLVDELCQAARDANDDFDHLAFVEDKFPVGGDCFGTYLAHNLSFLRDELEQLAMDLRTLGVTA